MIRTQVALCPAPNWYGRAPDWTTGRVTIAVEDARGYGPEIVERLRSALQDGACVWPDPRHPHLLVVEGTIESFYVAPLSSGKVMLLGYWQHSV